MIRIACLMGVLLLVGCNSEPKVYDDPIAVLMDRSEGHRNRWHAARQAEREMPADPKRIEALEKLVWVRGYPAEFSNYAVDELVEHDEAKAKKFLASAILICRDWDTINHIIDIAVERQWVDFVPALVRNYGLKTPVYTDAERPERKAIEKLMPGVPIEQVVMDVFAKGTDASITQRAAAWDLLHRMNKSQAELIAALNQIEANDDPLIVDLQAGARELGVVPDSIETITWLQMLRTPVYGSFWQSAEQVVAKLNDAQRDGLELRHLPMLIWFDRMDPSMLSASRSDLRQRVDAFYNSQDHHLKGPTYDGPMDEHPQNFRTYADTLAWADLLTLVGVTRWMNDRGIVERWFTQADADLKDESTEYGGLMLLDKQYKPFAQLYKPMIRKHDLAYYAPKELIIDAYTALAHFHFHAQDYHNRKYAGPGMGDMKRIARRQRFSALVLTFINEDAMNVDYYQGDDVIIDMGTIRR